MLTTQERARIRKSVRNGIAWFNRHGIDWASKIDEATLEMRYPGSCIAAQTVGWDRAMNMLGAESEHTDESLLDLGEDKLGFDVFPSFRQRARQGDLSILNEAFSYLQEYWIQQLHKAKKSSNVE